MAEEIFQIPCVEVIVQKSTFFLNAQELDHWNSGDG